MKKSNFSDIDLIAYYFGCFMSMGNNFISKTIFKKAIQEMNTKKGFSNIDKAIYYIFCFLTFGILFLVKPVCKKAIEEMNAEYED